MRTVLKKAFSVTRTLRRGADSKPQELYQGNKSSSFDDLIDSNVFPLIGKQYFDSCDRCHSCQPNRILSGNFYPVPAGFGTTKIEVNVCELLDL